MRNGSIPELVTSLFTSQAQSVEWLDFSKQVNPCLIWPIANSFSYCNSFQPTVNFHSPNTVSPTKTWVDFRLFSKSKITRETPRNKSNNLKVVFLLQSILVLNVYFWYVYSISLYKYLYLSDIICCWDVELPSSKPPAKN